ncbi:ERCC4-domain-containing protein [Suhomyces tanzawaensis NRRL Y-17324]|uniref:Crossover junction endonuclease MUS81 n=1 Tax=Suhomyces tanzawaensis NRRL Y-17324 TaxID=984487 RepID=A0A1E4SHC5_9ASCO|nr:ERCC4-domain-containing protein [Suhomyces tanzawaensis NRRL Y-17324]ODV78908.1 ERCC4-domain-containing protein [Suhomyces tanzawaensis NRRL Y-17324]
MDAPDFKPLFIEWIEEAAIDATKKGTKAALLYNRALDRLRHFEGPILNPKTLRLVQYIGDKTVKTLTAKLRKHCEQNKIEIPPEFAEKEEIAPEAANPSQLTKKPRKKKRYVPRHRSGGFAILIALYIGDKRKRGLTKDEIIKRAGPFADKSFTSNPASNEFYSAWNSVKVLISNDLVGFTGRPKMYFLTEEGQDLAAQLKDTVGIHSTPLKEYDVSYDNHVQVSPDQGLMSSPSKSILPEIHQEILGVHDPVARVYNGIKYDVWPHDEYEIILLIDNREIRSQLERDFFLNRLGSLNVKCEVRSLSVGDTLWIAQHKQSKKEVVLNYICERKKLDDLAMSIRDGRFQEQKNRLKKTGMKHYYYLVEESGIDNVIEMMDAIKTALSMTMTVSEFYLRRFKDVDETILFLASLTQVIQERLNGTKLIVLRPRSVNNQVEYSEILDVFRNEFEHRSTDYECVHLFSMFQDVLGKTGMMTVKEMFVLMLMTIRGVSLERAITIQHRFPTPKLLLHYYHVEHSNKSTEEKKKLLVKEFENEVGNKKIGKVCLEHIYEVWGVK